ncbi:MAG TPA: LuxR C-terminal-related transcriptional regulator [Dehalococcoidia bacterium]
MGNKVDLEIPAGRRHIIERPRLTRLLDETSARVIMLVAPAGYGKTTLARQWLATRPHAWYQASTASSDVAALALAVSEALEPFAPGAQQLLFERIGATRDVDEELSVLAEIQTDALQQWPNTAWLAVDDYQLVNGSEVAESYIHRLLSNSPLQLLLTSRVRPMWATARKLLYGEIYEIGRSPLAMSQDEAESVFHASSTDGLPGLVALAEGWPAVIGLASLTQRDHLDGVLPETLYEYFADELYQAASRALQGALPQLALSPHLTLEMSTSLFGPRRGPRLLEEACNLGFMTMTASSAELHPLLRAFLLRKLEGLPAAQEEAVRKIAAFHLEKNAWDDAFALLRQCPLPDVLLALINSALSVMLRAGRLSTLAEWLTLGAVLDLRSPVLELARAELAVRKGNVRDAETWALRVTKDEQAARSLSSRAFCLAGRAAHLDNREADALAHFRSARNLAEGEAERRDAMWGSFLCVQGQAFESEEELRSTLAEFVSQDSTSPDETLRSANARLIVGVTVSGISQALEEALAAKVCIADAVDPLVRTGFLNILTRSLSLAGRYAEAADIAEQEIEEAHRSRLAFVLPHAYVAKAVAAVGLRRYGEADRALSKGKRLAEEIGDRHNLLDIQTVRSKIGIATGDFKQALDLTREPQPRVQLTPVMLGEYAATRALARACDGDLAGARLTSRKAEKLSGFPEVASLIACARAVISVKDVGAKETRPAIELASVFRLSVFDPLVIAGRGCPELVSVLTSGSLKPLPPDLARALTQERIDVSESAPGLALLSPRETEVLDLLTLGYTNKEIAKALYIAEVTAKVHVRQILKKLGVRSRTQAALAAVRAT